MTDPKMNFQKQWHIYNNVGEMWARDPELGKEVYVLIEEDTVDSTAYPFVIKATLEKADGKFGRLLKWVIVNEEDQIYDNETEVPQDFTVIGWRYP